MNTHFLILKDFLMDINDLEKEIMKIRKKKS